MGCLRCDVQHSINTQFMCHFARSICTYKRSIKVITKFITKSSSKKSVFGELPSMIYFLSSRVTAKQETRQDVIKTFFLHFLRYGRWVTRRIAVATIAAIWMLAGFVSFVPISLSLHRPDQPLIFEDKDGKEFPTCALDLTPTYAVVSSCISFYVPCIVMIGIYCRWGTVLCLLFPRWWLLLLFMLRRNMSE